eukprot:2574419-Rhodomonas_salina.2
MRVEYEDETASPAGSQFLTSKVAWRILGERKKKRMAIAAAFEKQNVESSEDSSTGQSGTSSPVTSVEDLESPRRLKRSWRPVDVNVHLSEEQLPADADCERIQSPSGTLKQQHSPRWHTARARPRVSPCSLSKQRSFDHVQEDILRINKVITLQSVADKADEQWRQCSISRRSPDLRQSVPSASGEMYRRDSRTS